MKYLQSESEMPSSSKDAPRQHCLDHRYMFGYLPIYVTNQRVSRICGPLELRSAIQMVTVFLLLWIDVFAQQRSIS
jgi:hypothetical protein